MLQEDRVLRPLTSRHCGGGGGTGGTTRRRGLPLSRVEYFPYRSHAVATRRHRGRCKIWASSTGQQRSPAFLSTVDGFQALGACGRLDGWHQQAPASALLRVVIWWAEHTSGLQRQGTRRRCDASRCTSNRT
ncbi:uncharacterized protein [Triticum aestivum]|uniref:uncharacterized protein n=1 Tax=Triticum aestivum TaxID=4565 RepID=UPI001D03365F|nr:uncharacterized protein LOC123041567 [Triticum aestivum]